MSARRHVLAALLALEAVNSVSWASRILSAAAAYDVVVLGMVLLRVLVSALQGVSAWLLISHALPAVALARLALISSAVLLVFEVGLRLSPSGLTPGTRLPVIVAYAVYALAGVRALAQLDRDQV